MLDIKLIREDHKKIEAGLARRGTGISLNELMQWDAQRRKSITDIEQLRERRNAASKEISRIKDKSDKNVQKLIREMNSVREEVKQKEKALEELAIKIKDFLMSLPNIPDDSVPDGKSEKDNRPVRNSGNPREFDFEPKPHWEIGEKLGILDFSAAAKLSGARFSMLRGQGCRLERALIEHMLGLHSSRGYSEVFPPFLVSRESMTGTGQLPKFEDELFRCRDDELYLIPTAEVSVTNIHRNEILPGSSLPKYYACCSACFRREAGSYGKDTRGLIRNHQFNKVELVKIVFPEKSMAELEGLTSDAEEVLKTLGLTYRVIELCTADIGFGASKTYDLEVWMPGEKMWREISSCTNFKDFQARRLNMKVKRSSGEKSFVHTINGSGLAVGRTFAAILENYQNKDGSVTVPEPLRDYMKTDVIS